MDRDGGERRYCRVLVLGRLLSQERLTCRNIQSFDEFRCFDPELNNTLENTILLRPFDGIFSLKLPIKEPDGLAFPPASEPRVPSPGPHMVGHRSEVTSGPQRSAK